MPPCFNEGRARSKKGTDAWLLMCCDVKPAIERISVVLLTSVTERENDHSLGRSDRSDELRRAGIADYGDGFATRHASVLTTYALVRWQLLLDPEHSLEFRIGTKLQFQL
jgi:hypothetical protein